MFPWLQPNTPICNRLILGDFDPSGLDIARIVEKRLCEFAWDAEIHFQRVAVTPQQITELNLPTRPTKRSDSRSCRFEGGSVEVDAIPPKTLRDLARRCIEQHVDYDAYARLKLVEENERTLLSQLVESMDDEIDEADADAKEELG